MIKISAYQIADSIKLKEFKNTYTGQLIFSDSEELFYQTDEHKYVYIFKYGVVSFSNYNDVEATQFIQLLNRFCKNPISQTELNEEYTVEINANKYEVGYSNMSVSIISEDIFRLTMLYVSQSVALDHYTIQAEYLLEKSSEYIQELEQTGNIAQKDSELLKFIGKILNLRNKIVENLYIFDTHPVTWEDESLNKLENDLSRVFDLKQRYRNVSENLSIVKENLDLFKDLIQHKKSYFLEWTIVILIVVELIALLVEMMI